MALCGCFGLYLSWRAVEREHKHTGNFQSSVVKPKPKQLQWPTKTNVNNKTNQWELEANTRIRRQARENVPDQVAISFRFASDSLSIKANHRA